jgi:hypothetical protein
MAGKGVRLVRVSIVRVRLGASTVGCGDHRDHRWAWRAMGQGCGSG